MNFLNSGSPENPGYQHNIYINHIDTLIFRYNFTHDAIAEGHEFKSRANNNYIMYNRISNYNSVDSRNIDLPNGGTAIILGNIIEQAENSANSNIIGFGLEGLINPEPHNLWVCSNTIVNKKSKGSFVQVANIDTLFLMNNICVGAKTGGFISGNPSVLDSSYNFIDDVIESPLFVNVNFNDYHLTEESQVIKSGISLSKNVNGISLFPDMMYKDNSNFELRPSDGFIDIGAFEFVSPESVEVGKEIDNDIFVYPNPTNGIVRIELKDDMVAVYNLYITNLYGMKLDIETTKSGIDKYMINFGDLAPGVYFLIIKANKTVKAVKIYLVK